MTQTIEAEARKEASRLAPVRALENTLHSYRNALLADLARAADGDARQRVRDRIRDTARLIRNGLVPLLDWLARDGHDAEARFRVGRILAELDEFAHPAAALPADQFNAACAHCPLMQDLPRKLDLLAAGIATIATAHKEAGHGR